AIKTHPGGAHAWSDTGQPGGRAGADSPGSQPTAQARWSGRGGDGRREPADGRVSALAILLIAVGVADLVAARGRAHERTSRMVGALVGLGGIALMAALAGLSGWGDLALLGIAGLTTAAWVVLAGRADDTDRGQGVALGTLGVGGGLILLCSGWSSPAGGVLADWLEWSGINHLESMDPTRVLLLAGLFLTQLSTGNIVVRLVLTHTGALNPLGGPQASDRLRGGRLLGPMERVFILGLGLAGQVTAASIVIAAKGLIRWPELQKATRDSERHERDTERRERATGHTTATAARPVASIDQVTEY